MSVDPILNPKVNPNLNPIVNDAFLPVGVRLGHLLLALAEAHQHMVREDDRGAQPLSVRVLPSEHVHLPLVEAKLADVRAEEENIGALHAWVHDLCARELGAFLAPHDSAAALDAVHAVEARDLKGGRGGEGSDAQVV